jgi:hypothetical protein
MGDGHQAGEGQAHNGKQFFQHGISAMVTIKEQLF